MEEKGQQATKNDSSSVDKHMRLYRGSKDHTQTAGFFVHADARVIDTVYLYMVSLHNLLV